MIRKLTTVMISLLLAVMLPVAALAATQCTLTVLPGDELASIPMVQDVADVVALKLIEGEKSGALTLTLSGEDVVTLALGADETGLYVKSDLLGDDVFYINWNEGFDLLSEFLKGSMQAQGIADAQQIGALDSNLAQVKENLIAALSAEAIGQDLSGYHSLEDAKALVQEMYKDNPEMIELTLSIYDKMTEETGEFTDPARDTADTKTSIELNTEDIIAVCDSAYMRKVMAQSYVGEEGATEAEKAQAVEELIANVKDVFENGEYKMVMDSYAADGGKTLVGMEMTMEMTITQPVEEGETAQTPETARMTMTLNYDRLTGETAVSHKGFMVMDVQDDPLTAALDFVCGNDGTTDGFVGMLVAGTEMSATYNAQKKADGTSESLTSLYMRNGATALVEPAASERPLVSLKVITEEVDNAVLAAVDAANADNSVNVLALSEEEMGTLMNDVSGNVLEVGFGALEKLPANVVDALMGGESK